MSRDDVNYFYIFYQIGSCDPLKTAQTGAYLRRTGCERASRCNRADVVGGKVEMSRFCTHFATLSFVQVLSRDDVNYFIFLSNW